MASSTRKNHHDPNCVCNKCPTPKPMVNECELNYQNIVNLLDSIILLIVGNEPYPSGSNGIAFCKNTWPELMDGRCGGRYLLCSLGVDLCKAQDNYSSPVDLFVKMAKEKIVFVNQNDEFLYECLKKNINVARSCGSNILETIKKNIEGKVSNYEHFDRHPFPQGETNPPDINGNWFKYWGKYEKLLNILEPSGSDPIHTIINNINSL